jgi:murein DD-endopeptidase MepM/ murein hydrolase activator NlpD
MKIKRPVKANINSPFGKRTHPVTGEESSHWGVDFACDEGTEVVAVCDSSVCLKKTEEKAGNMLTLFCIVEGKKYFFNYFHLKQSLVNVGDKVKKGDIIGLSGNTGVGTGPHLHFEVWEDTAIKEDREKNCKDPEGYFEEVV